MVLDTAQNRPRRLKSGDWSMSLLHSWVEEAWDIGVACLAGMGNMQVDRELGLVC